MKMSKAEAIRLALGKLQMAKDHMEYAKCGWCIELIDKAMQQTIPELALAIYQESKNGQD